MDIAGPGGNMAARPKMLMCYLCGREYGSKSLPIHLPQCQKKWLDEEEKKPKKERRPLPKPPVEIPVGPGAKAIDMGSKSVDEFNEMMYSHWENVALEKCQFCGRTFRPEALKIHHKSCSAEKPAKPAGTGLTSASLSHNLPPPNLSGTKHAPPSPHEGHKGFEASTSGSSRKPSRALSIAGAGQKTGPAAAAGKAGVRVAPMPSGSSSEPSPTSTAKKASAPALDTSKLKAAIDDVASAKHSPSPSPISQAGTPTGLTKFCDECGTPYPRETSKFCAECGGRRPSSVQG